MSQFTDDQLVEMYVSSRDACKHIQLQADEQMMPHKKRMDMIGKLMMSRFIEHGSSSTKCSTGTAFIEEKYSVTTANGSAFMDFVVASESWDLIEKRPSKVAIRNYIQAAKEVPPGINYVVRKEVTFRRPNESSTQAAD